MKKATYELLTFFATRWPRRILWPAQLYRVRHLPGYLFLVGDCSRNLRTTENCTAKTVNIRPHANLPPNIGIQGDGGLCILLFFFGQLGKIPFTYRYGLP